jgi:hypothetical protein
MSFDPIQDAPKCQCGHAQDTHDWITNTGIFKTPGVTTDWHGRCKAKKCPCWRYKPKERP